MFKRKDDIKTFIVIISVCVICVVIGLILSFKSNYDKLEYVNEYNVYFSNVNYVNNFINKIASNDSLSLYGILNKKYIDSNNITINNVLDYFDDYSIHSSFNVDNMYFVQIRNNFIYYIEGKIYENGYDKEKELVDDNFSVVLSIDNISKCYSIYPVDDNYKNVINNIKKVNIDSNNYNSIVKFEFIDKEQVCAIYLSDYVNNVFDDIDNAYNLLSEEMKKKYSSSEDYGKYIDDNFDLISTVADKCRMENLGEKREYTVIDGNGNTYIFNEDSIMKYSVDFYLNGENE